MSDPVTPLNGASYSGFVTVTEAGPQGMITLRGDPGSDAIGDVIRAIADVDVPAQGRITAPAARRCGWMSPDELLLILPRTDVPDVLGEIAAKLDGTHHLAVDVSDARATFQLTGAKSRDVLAKLCPADLSPAALPPGMLRRSRLAQVPAALWFDEADAARVVCFRSVAQYVFDILALSAKPGGEVDLFRHSD